MVRVYERVVMHWVPAAQSFSRRHPFGFDSAVAALLSVLSVLTAQDTASYATEGPKSLGFAQLLAAGSLGLPFAVRRRAPIFGALLCVAFVALAAVLSVPDVGVSVLVGWFVIHGIAAFTTGRTFEWGRLLVVLFFVVGVVGFSIGSVVDDEVEANSTLATIRTILLVVFVFGGAIGTAWLSGLFTKNREDVVRLLAERNAALEQTQHTREREAVVQERVRIAREVHDVVAHHVSVMGVQAGAARRVIDRDQERASEMLANIEQSSRSALGDLSRLVMFLRDSTESTVVQADEPQPGLEDLDRLFDEVRAAGMDLTVEEVGDLSSVCSPSVGMCAYRIVQEALTNVRKHAGETAKAVVSFDRSPQGIAVTITNRGRVAAPTNKVPGHGLIGMRERVGLLGGSLTVGPIPGGFEVNAWLPFAGNAAAAPRPDRPDRAARAARIDHPVDVRP
jgi:signal transduction histidine kinase